MPETGAFGSVDLLSGKDAKGVDVSGQERDRWVTNVKRALFSSRILKGTLGNKVLTFLRVDAAQLFEKRAPESAQVIGSEGIVFDELKKKYPGQRTADVKFEKLVNMVT